MLSKNDRFNEYVMTGLRTIWGVSLAKIEKEFGIRFRTHFENLSRKNIDKGLLIYSNNTIKISEKGKFLADGIASEMFMI